MAENSKIEWTEATWNPIVGCSVHSPGCRGCYAMRVAWRLMHNPNPKIAAKFAGTAKMTKVGPVFTGRVNLDEGALLAPLRRKKPTVYFVNSLSDLFHVNVPDEWIDRIFAVMALCPQHVFQVLTKRADRMRAYLSGAPWGCIEEAAAAHRPGFTLPDGIPPLPNVWLGVSVEDQKRANERREDFRATPAAVKFVSYEPAIGPVDWAGWEFVQQIIGGGESGPRARPMHPDWQRSTRDFCADHRIAYFFKQWGEYRLYYDADPDLRDLYEKRFIDEGTSGPFVGVGKKKAGRLLDGAEHNGMPFQSPAFGEGVGR